MLQSECFTFCWRRMLKTAFGGSSISLDPPSWWHGVSWAEPSHYKVIFVHCQCAARGARYNNRNSNSTSGDVGALRQWSECKNLSNIAHCWHQLVGAGVMMAVKTHDYDNMMTIIWCYDAHHMIMLWRSSLVIWCYLDVNQSISHHWGKAE